MTRPQDSLQHSKIHYWLSILEPTPTRAFWVHDTPKKIKNKNQYKKIRIIWTQNTKLNLNWPFTFRWSLNTLPSQPYIRYNINNTLIIHHKKKKKELNATWKKKTFLFLQFFFFSQHTHSRAFLRNKQWQWYLTRNIFHFFFVFASSWRLLFMI